MQVLLQYSAVVLLGKYPLLRAMPQAAVRRRLRLEEEAKRIASVPRPGEMPPQNQAPAEWARVPSGMFGM